LVAPLVRLLVTFARYDLASSCARVARVITSSGLSFAEMTPAPVVAWPLFGEVVVAPPPFVLGLELQAAAASSNEQNGTVKNLILKFIHKPFLV
jgi:hypothetical protein